MPYELFAIRYATSKPDRARYENFLGLQFDPHDAPLPLDFFVWVARGGGRTILIDGGCSSETAAKRGHIYLRNPIESLKFIGVEPKDVDTVISTHLHYDHAGNFDMLPNATFHAAPEEIRHAVGPCMCQKLMRRPYDVDEVCEFVRLVYADRVVYHSEPSEVAPGLWMHPVGGHTPGLSFVVATTRRGTVVLASDAMHFYDNGRLRLPYPVLTDVARYFEGLDKVYRYADSPEHIVPGHDPAVLRRYPPVSEKLAGVAVRLDVAPKPAEGV